MQGGLLIWLSAGDSGGAVDALVSLDGLSMWLGLLLAWLLGSKKEYPKSKSFKTLEKKL